MAMGSAALLLLVVCSLLQDGSGGNRSRSSVPTGSQNLQHGRFGSTLQFCIPWLKLGTLMGRRRGPRN